MLYSTLVAVVVFFGVIVLVPFFSQKAHVNCELARLSATLLVLVEMHKKEKFKFNEQLFEENLLLYWLWPIPRKTLPLEVIHSLEDLCQALKHEFPSEAERNRHLIDTMNELRGTIEDYLPKG